MVPRMDEIRELLGKITPVGMLQSSSAVIVAAVLLGIWFGLTAFIVRIALSAAVIFLVGLGWLMGEDLP